MRHPDIGGSGIRQTPRSEPLTAQSTWPSAAQPATPVFLNLGQASKLLGVSERTFHELRHRGLVPEPIQLGPRALRWLRDELIEHARQAAPRGGMPMPKHLARGPEAKRAVTERASS